MKINDDKKFFCSWSGGKDSCLALYHALEEGGQAALLLTMMIENGERSRSHGLPLSLFREQSRALSIPLYTAATGWGDYEENFISCLQLFREQGIKRGVFGDIDLEEHREWVQQAAGKAGIQACHPIWKRDRRELVEEFIELGFRAKLVAVQAEFLDRDFLGRDLDLELVREMEELGVDAAGENGEYHTVVYDGPIFSRPLELHPGEQLLRDGYWFQDVQSGCQINRLA